MSLAHERPVPPSPPGPGESSPPDPAAEVVTTASVDSERACDDTLREAASVDWPPCGCPQHRNQPNKTLTGGA